MTNKSLLGIIFANMHDEFIHGLTINRTTASVPFGGRYRLIDFTLSNMVNSGITEVGVIAKSNYRSLMDHVGSGKEWDLSRKCGGLSILPPYSTSTNVIYRGNIEALYGALHYIENSTAEYVVLSDSCTILNIDLQDLVDEHISKNAEITVVYSQNNNKEKSNVDRIYLDCDEEGFLTAITSDIAKEEKPDIFNKQYCNIMVVKKDKLLHMTREAMIKNRFSIEKDILPRAVNKKNVYCYEKKGVVLNVRDMDSYIEANMQLLDKNVRDSLFQKDRPIYTKVRDQVPTKYGINADVKNSLIADGCIIEGTVRNSIIFRGVKIEKGAVVENSIVMQNTYVSENGTLEYVVTDKNVVIGQNRKLCGYITYPIYVEKGRHI